MIPPRYDVEEEEIKVRAQTLESELDTETDLVIV